MALKGKYIDFPIVPQEKDYTCGIACVNAFLKFNKIKKYDEEIIEDLVDPNPKYGASYKDIVSFFDKKGLHPIVRHKLSIEDLYKILDHKRPLLICLQAHSGAKHPDYKEDWDNGHYVVVVGYNENQIIFMDPWTPALNNKYAYLPAHELMDRWHFLDGDKQIGLGIMIINLNNIDPPTKLIDKKILTKMK